MGRTIAIGDIHACYDELVALLNKLGLRGDDRVVAVGDLTAKGPKNSEVLALFAGDSRFSSVLGNYDLSVIRHWRDEAGSLKPSVERALNELKTGGDRYLHYLASLPFAIDLGSHVVIHAGLRPGIELGKQSIDDLTQLRTLGPDRRSREGTPWYDEYAGPQIALFGHWPAPQPRLSKYAIGLDTGCVYGHRLTAYIVETGQFVSVPAVRAYAKLQKNRSDP